MSKSKKPKIEFRHYQMPWNCPVLALLGEKWIQVYGRDIDYLHFHNYLEVGYCYSGTALMWSPKDVLRRPMEMGISMIPLW